MLPLISKKSGGDITQGRYSAITYKFWDKSEITLSVGQFLKIDKLNPPIAKKFTGIQKRFVKY